MFKINEFKRCALVVTAILLSSAVSAAYEANTALEQLRVDTYLMIKHASYSVYEATRGDSKFLFDNIDRSSKSTNSQKIAVEAAYRTLDIVLFGKQNKSQLINEKDAKRIINEHDWKFRDATAEEVDGGVLNAMAQTMGIAVYTILFDAAEHKKHDKKHDKEHDKQQFKTKMDRLDKINEKATRDMKNAKAEADKNHLKVTLGIMDYAFLQSNITGPEDLIDSAGYEPTSWEFKQSLDQAKQKNIELLSKTGLDSSDFELTDYAVQEGITIDEFDPTASFNTFSISSANAGYVFSKYADLRSRLQAKHSKASNSNFVFLPRVRDHTAAVASFLGAQWRAWKSNKPSKASTFANSLVLNTQTEQQLKSYVDGLEKGDDFVPQSYIYRSKQDSSLNYIYASQFLGTQFKRGETNKTNKQNEIHTYINTYPKNKLGIYDFNDKSKTKTYPNLYIYCNQLGKNTDLSRLKAQNIFIKTKTVSKDVYFSPHHQTVQNLEIEIEDVTSLNQAFVSNLLNELLKAYTSYNIDANYNIDDNHNIATNKKVTARNIYDYYQHASFTLKATGIGKLLTQDTQIALAQGKLKPKITSSAHQIKVEFDSK